MFVLDSRPKILRSAWHEIAFCITIFFSQLLTQASLGNAIVILRYIADDLNVGDKPMEWPWFAASYSLTVGVFILITGRLGDVFGHKRLFVLGFVWYAIISLVIGFAPYTRSSIFFDIFRALQGIGPATVLPNGVALLARVYPNGQRKSLVFALFGATAPSGFVVGALFAALFAQFSWWPWSQWVLAMVCLLVALSAQFIVVPSEVSEPVNSGGRIDYAGAVTGIIGLVLFVYAWNEAPLVGWDKPYVFVLLIVGILVIGLFVVIESRVPEYAIMPLDVFTDPGFPGVIACVGLGWSSFGIFTFYMVQLLQTFRGASPLLTTAQCVPVIFSGLAATLIVSVLIHRIASHWVLGLSMVAFCVGNTLLATATVESTYWSFIFVAFVVTPFGMDMSYPASSLIVSNALPPERQGVGASMINTVINMSISLGLGIAGTVEAQVNDGRDPWRGHHGACYVGIGLSGLGILVAILFCRVPVISKHGEGKSVETGSLDAATDTAANESVSIPVSDSPVAALPAPVAVSPAPSTERANPRAVDGEGVTRVELTAMPV